MGTAKDSRGPFFQRRREADLGDGLTYRKAFSTDAAQAVVAHLVNDRGLELHRDDAAEVEGRPAPQEPGQIVFIYRKIPAATAAPGSEHATFRRLSASWLPTWISNRARTA